MEKAAIFPYTTDTVTLFENRHNSLTPIDSILCFKEDLKGVSNAIKAIPFDMSIFKERGIDSIIASDNLLNNPLSSFQKILLDASHNGLEVQATPYLYDQLKEGGFLNNLPLHEKLSIISLDPFCIDKQLSKIYPINIPVIAVMGLAPNSSKFDIQIELRKAFEQAGYKASVISSNPLGKLLGMRVYPEFMFQNYSLEKKIYGFNHYVHKIIREDLPDVIIVGIPNGIIPYNQKIHNGFGELATTVCNAVHPDFGILASGLLDVIDTDYFTELKLLCKYRFDTEIFAFCISNNKIQENDTNDGYDTYFLSNEFVKSVVPFGQENIHNVFYNSDFLMRKQIFNKLIEELEANANVIC